MVDNTATNTFNDEKPAVSLKEMKKFEKWTKSLQYITGVGMTEEEKKDFKKRLDVDLEEYQCNQCEVWKDNLLKNSKVFRRQIDRSTNYLIIFFDQVHLFDSW